LLSLEANLVGDLRDEDGSDDPDQPAARIAAIDSIRGIVSEEARGGSLDLTGFIEVFDENRNCLLHVSFAEAFDLKLRL
jgi:hypothetical protein